MKNEDLADPVIGLRDRGAQSGKGEGVSVRAPADLDRLSRLCWRTATARSARRLPRAITNRLDVTRADGTLIPAGTLVNLPDAYGLCESINYLAAEVLEAIEGTRWYAWSGRFGYVPEGVMGEGVITDHHTVLALGAPTIKDLSPLTTFADFSLRSAFFDSPGLPYALKGMLGRKPSRGWYLVAGERFDGVAKSEDRTHDESLGNWVCEQAPVITEQFLEGRDADEPKRWMNQRRTELEV